MTRQLISILLENEPGALSRVVGLFAQRNYNIETLSVAPTEDPTLSRITLTTVADGVQLKQIVRQVNKLIEVYSVKALGGGCADRGSNPFAYYVDNGCGWRTAETNRKTS